MISDARIEHRLAVDTVFVLLTRARNGLKAIACDVYFARRMLEADQSGRYTRDRVRAVRDEGVRRPKLNTMTKNVSEMR